MELSETNLDEVALEKGAWIDNIPDFGDVRLRVRGQWNADWRRLHSRLVDNVPLAKKVGGRIDPDELDKILRVLLTETSLLEWDNLTENGVPIPFTKEKAAELMLRRRFRAAVSWASTVVGQQTAAANGNAAGNSGSGSNGI